MHHFQLDELGSLLFWAPMIRGALAWAADTNQLQRKVAGLLVRLLRLNRLGCLLFLATLAQILLAWASGSAQRQREAVEVILNARAGVSYRGWEGEYFGVDDRDRRGPRDESPSVRWLSNHLGVDYCYDVAAVEIGNLSHGWSFDETKMDETLVAVSNLQNLESLSFRVTTLKDEQLKHLKNLSNLKSLEFWKADLSDPLLATLPSLPKLNTILIANSDPPDRGPKVTDEGLRHLAKQPALTSVLLLRVPLTQKAMGHLASCRNLNELTLWCFDSPLSRDAISQLNGSSIKSLRLDGEQINDETIRDLRSFSTLEALLIESWNVTESCFDDIAQMRNLKLVEFRGAGVKRASALKLLKKRPDLKIRVHFGDLYGAHMVDLKPDR